MKNKESTHIHKLIYKKFKHPLVQRGQSPNGALLATHINTHTHTHIELQAATYRSIKGQILRRATSKARARIGSSRAPLFLSPSLALQLNIYTCCGSRKKDKDTYTVHSARLSLARLPAYGKKRARARFTVVATAAAGAKARARSAGITRVAAAALTLLAATRTQSRRKSPGSEAAVYRGRERDGKSWHPRVTLLQAAANENIYVYVCVYIRWR